MEKRLDIQGLRALAVIGVILYHSGIKLPGGYLGVDIFFVISGFVISQLLLREQRASSSISLKQFYKRRFWRLTPALATMLVCTLILSVFFSSPAQTQKTIFLTSLGASFFAGNMAVINYSGGYFDGPTQLNALLHTWSLGIEEQFYFVFPLLLLFSRSKQSRLLNLKRLLWVFIPLASVSLVFFSFGNSASSSKTIQYIFGYYAFTTRIWQLLLGCILGAIVFYSSTVQKHNKITSIGRLMALVGIICCYFSTGLTSGWPNIGSILACCFAGICLLVQPSTDSDLGTRILSSKPFVFIGDRSYSLYLWHFPVFVFSASLSNNPLITNLVAFSATVAFGILSFRFIEKPFLSSKSISPKTNLRRGLTVVAIPLLVCASCIFGYSTSWGNESVATFQNGTNTSSYASANGCAGRNPLPSKGNCLISPNTESPSVFLIGDSNAGQLSDALVSATTDLKVTLQISTPDACPFVEANLLDISGKYRNEDCRNFVNKSVNYLSSSKPSVVLIANSNSYTHEQNFLFLDDRGQLVKSESEKRAIYMQGLRKLIKELKSHGHIVYVVQSVPKFDNLWDPRECDLIQIESGDCQESFELKQWNQWDSEIRKSIESISDAHSVSVLDLGPLICSNGICKTGIEAEQFYKDAGHLSVSTSEQFGGFFQKVIKDGLKKLTGSD